MKRIFSFSLLSLLILIFISGCNDEASNLINQIHVSDIPERMAQSETSSDGAVFVDVREVNEYDEGHIEGFINYPLSSLEKTLNELPKDKEIIVICRSGNRSMQAVSILKENGFDHVTNVEGAMLEWEGKTKTN